MEYQEIKSAFFEWMFQVNDDHRTNRTDKKKQLAWQWQGVLRNNNDDDKSYCSECKTSNSGY